MDCLDEVRAFFTKEEWGSFSELEKTRYTNAFNLYHKCFEEGVELPKPEFMEQNKENVPINVPEMNVKTTKKVRFQLPPKVYPKRKLPKVNYKEDEIPARDGYIYCDNCEEEFENYCPKCGMLEHIFDTNVRKGTKDRARKTLPANLLEIKKSKIHGEGVFALKTIPRMVKFGPYEGLETVQSTSGYAWKLRYGKLVDAADVKYSNWMRFVNCARNVQEQNLLAFQYEGKFYYRTVKEIKKGDELLVFYGEEYAEILSIDVKKYFEPVSEKMNNTYACFSCCLGFTQEEFLTKHMLKCPYKIVKEGPSKGIVPCPFCKIYVVNLTYLEGHVKYCKEKYKNASTGGRNDYEEKSCFAITKRYSCSHCKYTTDHSGHFLDHTRIHEGIKPFECSICSKTFSRKENLKKHVRVHTGETPFECDKCRRRFNDKSALTRHIRHKHSDERIFACNYCTYRCVESSDLKNHIKLHTKIDMFDCKMCSKKFTAKQQLKRHMNIHLGIKFECPKCDYSPHDRKNLKRHHVRCHSK